MGRSELVRRDSVESANVTPHKRGTRLKPLVLLSLLLLLIAILFGACSGDDGAVFIQFTHGTGFYFFVYDDPNLPNSIATFRSYRTKPGSYYVEWTYDNIDPPHWYAYYSIKADEGGAFWSDGDDRTFELYMGRGVYDFGQLSGEDIQPTPVIGSRSQQADRLPIDTTEARVIDSYTQRSGRYTLEVTVFEQAEPEIEADEE